MNVEVVWDGRTVWVNGEAGAVGRFGPMGVDVHTVDTTGCLLCTHEPTGYREWLMFVAAMAFYHGAVVPDEAIPTRLALGCERPG